METPCAVLYTEGAFEITFCGFGDGRGAQGLMAQLVGAVPKSETVALPCPCITGDTLLDALSPGSHLGSKQRICVGLSLG